MQIPDGVAFLLDMTTLRILVILPCHNEQTRSGPVIESVKRVLPDAAVAVIDDGSSDATALEASLAGISVLPHVVNLGYGAALETGYLFAEKKNYDIVLQMDGDGQHLAEELPKLLKPIMDGSADIVIGSRYLDPAQPRTVSFARRIGQMLFSWILLAILRKRITDPTSGFQALNRRAVRFFSSGVFPCDYPDADVVMMAHLAGLRVKEVPTVMAAREGGQSMHSGFKPIYYGIRMLLSLFVVLLNFRKWRQWRRTPNLQSPQV